MCPKLVSYQPMQYLFDRGFVSHITLQVLAAPGGHRGQVVVGSCGDDDSSISVLPPLGVGLY